MRLNGRRWGLTGIGGDKEGLLKTWAWGKIYKMRKKVNSEETAGAAINKNDWEEKKVQTQNRGSTQLFGL